VIEEEEGMLKGYVRERGDREGYACECGKRMRYHVIFKPN